MAVYKFYKSEKSPYTSTIIQNNNYTEIIGYNGVTERKHRKILEIDFKCINYGDN